MVITMPLLFIIGKWWFNKFYEKYIVQIKNLVKELRQ
jgi:hypothetical protein